MSESYTTILTSMKEINAYVSWYKNATVCASFVMFSLRHKDCINYFNQKNFKIVSHPQPENIIQVHILFFANKLLPCFLSKFIIAVSLPSY